MRASEELRLWLELPLFFDNLETPKSLKPLLLDLFPPEVRISIAFFVSSGSQSEELLALARTSPIQRSAVVQALNHRCLLSADFAPHVLSRWADVFMDDVKEVVYEKRSFRNFPPTYYHYRFSLFQASTLRKITFSDSDNFYESRQYDVFEAILNSASIQEVKVFSRRPGTITPLLRTLSTISVKSLELVCTALVPGCCYFRDPAEVENIGTLIHTCCPNLRELHMYCENLPDVANPCNPKSCLGHAVLFSLKNMPSLEAITIHTTPRLEAITVPTISPENMLPFLDGKREIRLHDGNKTAYDAGFLTKIAPTLTAIWTMDCFSESRRGQLAECVNLKELETNVEKGSEKVLGDILKRLPHLCRLTLTWETTSMALEMLQQEIRGLRHRDRNEFSRLLGLRDAESRDLAKNIVNNIPRVEKLCLRGLRISETDLSEMLSSVGNRLREFEIDLSKNKRPFEMLEMLLWLVLAHCRELRLLRFACIPTKFIFKYAKAGQWDSQMLKVERALAAVRKRMPMLDVSDNDKVIGSAHLKRR